MRRSIIIMALCLLTSWTWAQEFQKTSSGIKTAISGKQTDIEIQWFGPNTLRVLKTPQGKSVKKESLHEWTFRVASDVKPAHGQSLRHCPPPKLLY